jgi:N-methylhydantoinase B
MMAANSAESLRMQELGELELIRESLVAVVSEMRANVIHSSYSSIIYEGHDFSCALLTADGRQVAQSVDDHPIHLFAVPYSTQEVIRKFAGDIHEGDIFLHNDPYTGGTHLNDILMLCPVFDGGQLAMFAAVRCHWGDVGGMSAGSISGRVKEIFQEGMRVVPTKICDRGVMNEAFLRLLIDNMRVPLERRGDFNTMHGAGRKAEDHLQRLFGRFGAEAFIEGIEELIRRGEAYQRRRISELPDGDYYAEGYIESDGHSPEPLVAMLKLTVAGDTLIADFSGSSPQAAGPTNVGPAMARNAVVTIAKSFLDPDSPINHGSFAPIDVIIPEGSFLNARSPAPCGGMAEVKFLLDSTVAVAFGQIVPDMMTGDARCSANHTYMSGPYPEINGIYLLYEYPAGGTGAIDGRDGHNGIRVYTEGDFNAIQSSEIVESQNPLRVERCELREGSCGDGEWRGGFGIRRDIRIFNDQSTLSVLSDKNVIPPYSVKGATNPAANRFVVVRDGDIVEPSPIPGKVTGFPMGPGDVMRMETSGGGGYGDPLKRDPEAVKCDVKEETLTVEQAELRYGVILDAQGGLDEAGTANRRRELLAARVMLTIQAANDEMFEGPKRMFMISDESAKRLAIEEGDMIEITTGKGANVRGWTRISEADSNGAIVLGPSTIRLVLASAGEHALVRPVLRAPAV